jgi:hypothetical protein
MKVVLQHKPRRQTLYTPTEINASHYFEVDCVAGVSASHKFLCPSGEELMITCNGSVSGRGRRLSGNCDNECHSKDKK